MTQDIDSFTNTRPYFCVGGDTQERSSIVLLASLTIQPMKAVWHFYLFNFFLKHWIKVNKIILVTVK